MLFIKTKFFSVPMKCEGNLYAISITCNEYHEVK